MRAAEAERAASRRYRVRTKHRLARMHRRSAQLAADNHALRLAVSMLHAEIWAMCAAVCSECMQADGRFHDKLLLMN